MNNRNLSSQPRQGDAMVDATLLGDLVRILAEVKDQQRTLVEQEKLANAYRAALVRAQEETARHQKALAEQQRVASACAIRRELRLYNNMSTDWKPLPLLNGDPLPADIEFPRNTWDLKQMKEASVRRLAALYDLGDDQSLLEGARDNVSLFLSGRRT